MISTLRTYSTVKHILFSQFSNISKTFHFSPDHDDQASDDGNVIEEAIEVPEKKVKDESKDAEPKKRIIRNPQPKLDPDRICGPRGIGTLEEVFANFKPKGGDHVFEDLDVVMKKMEHWAHRLYPKLPCDDVMSRISFLGKRMAIQTNVKKLRMGMAPPPIDVNADPNADADGETKDETSRYDNEFPNEDTFDDIVRQAEEAFKASEEAKKAESTLTDEQRERMERNKKMAAEKRKAREMAKLAMASSQDHPEDDEVHFVNEDQPPSQVFESASKTQIPMDY